MANEVLITDLVSQQATQQLLALNKMLDETLSKMLAINKSTVGGGNAKTTDEAVKQQQALVREQEKLNQLKSQAGQIAEKEQTAVKELIKAKKLEAQASNEQIGAYKRLEAQAQLATMRAKNLAAQYGVNSQQAKKAAIEANNYNTRLKEIDKTMNLHQRNVGNYSSATDGLWSRLKSLSIVTIAVTAATKLFTGMINSSEDAADKFSFIMKGADFATKAFFRTLEQGDWSNLIDNMKEAANVGYEYAEALDIIEKNTRDVTGYHKLQSKYISELEEKMKNANIAPQEALKAAKELAQIQQEYYLKQSQIAQQTIDANTKALGVEEELIKKYIEFGNSNIYLRKQAQDYNAALQKRNNIEKQYLDYKSNPNYYGKEGEIIPKRDPTKDLEAANIALQKFSNDAIEFGRLINEIEGKNEELTTATIDAVVKKGEADAAYYNENKRLVTRQHSLEKQVSDDMAAAAAKRLKDLEELRKKELDWYNALKFKPKEISDFNKELNETVDLYVTLLKEIETASRNNMEIPMIFEKLPAELEKSTYWTDKFNEKTQELSQTFEDEKENISKIVNGITDIGNSISNIIGSINDIYAQQADNQIKSNDRAKENALKNLEILHGADIDYNEQKIALEAEYERRRDEIAKREFERSKKLKMIQAGMDLAMAQIGIWATVSQSNFWTVLTESAAIGALFTINFEKIRQSTYSGYAKGRIGGDDEMAFVGEKGFEYISTPTGQLYKTPNTATLTHLGEGYSVFPHEVSKQIDKYVGMPSVSQVTKANTGSPEVKELLSEMRKFNRKPTATMNIDRNGFDIMLGNINQKQRLIDKHLRHTR